MTKFFLKTSTLFFFVILMAQGIYAQKAKLSYDKKTDIISADNVPFAKMVRTPGDLIGLNKNYSIQNLEGEELVFLKYTLREHWDREEQKNVSTIWYEITFTQSGARASIEKGLGMQKSGAMKLAFQNDLIKICVGLKKCLNLLRKSVRKKYKVLFLFYIYIYIYIYLF